MENKKDNEQTLIKKVNIKPEMANANKPPIPKIANFTVKKPIDNVEADENKESDSVAQEIHTVAKHLDFNQLQEDRRRSRRRAFAVVASVGAIAVLSAIIVPVSIVYSSQQESTPGDDNTNGPNGDGNNNNPNDDGNTNGPNGDGNNNNPEVVATLNSAKTLIEKEGFVTIKQDAAKFVSAADVDVNNVHKYINIPQLKSLSDVKVEVIETSAINNGAVLEVTIQLSLQNHTSIAKVSLGGFIDYSRDADLILDFFLATKPLFKGDAKSVLPSAINKSNLHEMFVNLPTSNNPYGIQVSIDGVNPDDRIGFLNITFLGKIVRGNGNTSQTKHTYLLHGFKKAVA